MTNFKTIKAVSLGAAVAAALTSGVAAAEVTANAAAASNYIWRGVTQTSDQAAVQGGIDWSGGPGFYAGTWVSNVNFDNSDDGYEMDVYAGWGGEAGGFGYDLGVLTYQYPVTPEFNFTEVYASGTFSVLTIGVNLTVDNASGNTGGIFVEDDVYVYGSLDFSTKPGDFSLYAGSYSFDNDGKPGVGDVNYVHYGASWSKGDFSFAVDKNDIDTSNALSGGDITVDNVRFTVMWSKDFELM